MRSQDYIGQVALHMEEGPNTWKFSTVLNWRISAAVFFQIFQYRIMISLHYLRKIRPSGMQDSSDRKQSNCEFVVSIWGIKCGVYILRRAGNTILGAGLLLRLRFTTTLFLLYRGKWDRYAGISEVENAANFWLPCIWGIEPCFYVTYCCNVLRTYVGFHNA